MYDNLLDKADLNTEKYFRNGNISLSFSNLDIFNEGLIDDDLFDICTIGFAVTMG